MRHGDPGNEPDAKPSALTRLRRQIAPLPRLTSGTASTSRRARRRNARLLLLLTGAALNAAGRRG